MWIETLSQQQWLQNLKVDCDALLITDDVSKDFSQGSYRSLDSTVEMSVLNAPAVTDLWSAWCDNGCSLYDYTKLLRVVIYLLGVTEPSLDTESLLWYGSARSCSDNS